MRALRFLWEEIIGMSKSKAFWRFIAVFHIFDAVVQPFHSDQPAERVLLLVTACLIFAIQFAHGYFRRHKNA